MIFYALTIYFGMHSLPVVQKNFNTFAECQKSGESMYNFSRENITWACIPQQKKVKKQ